MECEFWDNGKHAEMGHLMRTNNKRAMKISVILLIEVLGDLENDG